MLFLSGEMSQPRRIQSAFLSEEEIKKVVSWLTNNYQDELPENINLDGQNKKIDMFDNLKTDSSRGGDSFGSDEADDDDLYEEAKEVVISAGKASTSYLQRKLRVGYSRAARLMDILEERGVIGPADGAKPREILVGPDSGHTEDNTER
jgi:S-DNA-T family DNA segregation ATPase FtsK/SpoIIIE